MYTVRLDHNGRTLRFNTDTRVGAFIMFDALSAVHPQENLSVWYGGTKLEDQRTRAFA
jgi:hypothetical protein